MVRDFSRLLWVMVEASAILTASVFAVASTAGALLPMGPAAVLLIIAVPDAIALWFLYRKLRGRYPGSEVIAVSTSFGLVGPVLLMAALFIGEVVEVPLSRVFNDVLAPIRLAIALIAAVVIVALLTSFLSLISLRIARSRRKPA